MSGQARVDSFAILTQFRASLATFASTAAMALDEAGTDIQRTLLWLREDRYRYWKAQVQTRTQQYTQAKLALKQREVLDRAIAGSRSSCVEERRARADRGETASGSRARVQTGEDLQQPD